MSKKTKSIKKKIEAAKATKDDFTVAAAKTARAVMKQRELFRYRFPRCLAVREVQNSCRFGSKNYDLAVEVAVRLLRGDKTPEVIFNSLPRFHWRRTSLREVSEILVRLEGVIPPDELGKFPLF